MGSTTIKICLLVLCKYENKKDIIASTDEDSKQLGELFKSLQFKTYIIENKISKDNILSHIDTLISKYYKKGRKLELVIYLSGHGKIKKSLQTLEMEKDDINLNEIADRISKNEKRLSDKLIEECINEIKNSIYHTSCELKGNDDIIYYIKNCNKKDKSKNRICSSSINENLREIYNSISITNYQIKIEEYLEFLRYHIIYKPNPLKDPSFFETLNKKMENILNIIKMSSINCLFIIDMCRKIKDGSTSTLPTGVTVMASTGPDDYSYYENKISYFTPNYVQVIENAFRNKNELSLNQIVEELHKIKDTQNVTLNTDLKSVNMKLIDFVYIKYQQDLYGSKNITPHQSGVIDLN